MVASPSELEAELLQIPGVTEAKVVADGGGDIVEVRVVADERRHPDQVARDVHTIALDRCGVDVDREVVSVLPEPAPVTGQTATGRPRLHSVAASQEGLRTRVDVSITRAGHEAVGTAEGASSATALPRVIADATLSALLQLDPVVPDAEVEDARIIKLGERDVAAVSVLLLNQDHEDVVSGSAVVRQTGVLDAVVRAVMDATNRRLRTP
ncbi:MAG TPA: hypothetical protein VFH45_08245 [Acidimicrobiales bacterium]|nr:hypothetical protein [Acidimicrobiales bacterium]